MTWDLTLLHTRYAQTVFDYAHRRLTSQTEAEDVTVEVFTEAITAFARFKSEASPRTFLLAIARRKVADSLRRKYRRRESLHTEMNAGWADRLVDNAAAPEAQVQHQEHAQQIRLLVNALPEAQREALLLQYADNLTIAEIGIVMG